MRDGRLISEVHNPFDFGNPVTDRNLFSGREKELADIRYYLDQAMKAPRPINLALLGSRAAGKTSLLNMIEIEARNRGMCTTRINLNEGDSQDEMSFFYKIFDCVFTSACDFRFPNTNEQTDLPFGGKAGKTYQTYLDMISAYEVPEVRTWCPFIFPLQYAKSMNRGIKGAKVSDQNFMNDLVLIRKETDRPIVLLFDECNVLANQRILLEMLRNIFMNIPGYMLVFTGTQDLFPVMDEVFSPIVRQFKKIEVGSFENTTETKECISKPLESIGIIDLHDIIERRTLTELNQIHDLTGGRPYEIQLLCHFMFRRVQLGRGTKMELDLDVLDDVLNELERGQNISSRPVINAIKELEKRQISALSLLLSCNAHATFDQLWFVEFVLNGTRRWQKEELLIALEEFLAGGIINLENNVLRFGGDDFDRIYTKYYARQRRIGLAFVDRSPQNSFNSKLVSLCQKTAGLRSFSDWHILDIVHNLGLRDQSVWKTEATEHSDIFSVWEQLRRDADNESDVVTLFPSLVEKIYWLMFENEILGCQASTLLNVSVNFPWTRQNYPFYAQVEYQPDSLARLVEQLELMSCRAKDVGGCLTFSLQEIETVSIEKLAFNLNTRSNKELVKSLVGNHFGGMVVAYLAKDRKLDVAKLHAKLVKVFDIETTATNLNNYGYLQLALGNLEEAREFLTAAIEKAGYDNSAAALPYYNRGVLELKVGNAELALKDFRSCLRLCEEGFLAENKSVTVFVPIVSGNGTLEFKEHAEVNLLDTVHQVIDVFENLTDRVSNNEGELLH